MPFNTGSIAALPGLLKVSLATHPCGTFSLPHPLPNGSELKPARQEPQHEETPAARPFLPRETGKQSPAPGVPSPHSRAKNRKPRPRRDESCGRWPELGACGAVAGQGGGLHSTSGAAAGQTAGRHANGPTIRHKDEAFIPFAGLPPLSCRPASPLPRRPLRSFSRKPPALPGGPVLRSNPHPRPGATP